VLSTSLQILATVNNPIRRDLERMKSTSGSPTRISAAAARAQLSAGVTSTLPMFSRWAAS